MVAEEKEDKSLQIAEVTTSPNPTNDRVTINVNKLKENYSYQLLDLSGTQLTQGELNNPETSIDFSNYAMGMYYIKILSSKNKTLETFHVIKNK